MNVYMEASNLNEFDSVKNSDFIDFTNFEVSIILLGPMCSLYPRRAATIRFSGAWLRVFFGVRIWLDMTFNYPVLWVRVKVLGSVNSNHNHNPKHIYNPNLTLILTITLNLP